MRFTRAALLVSAAALLAACQDSPTTSNLSPNARFNWYKPSDYAAHGITQVGHAKGTLGAQNNGPRAIIPPCDIDCPYEYADFDYGSYTSNSTDYTWKYVQLNSYSDSYYAINALRLTVYYDVAGAQSGSYCNNTPSQYDSDATQYGYGDGVTLTGGRSASYNYSASFVWRVRGSHYFSATSGYSVDGYRVSRTFSSSASVCY
jgi:hypothetical protein